MSAANQTQKYSDNAQQAVKSSLVQSHKQFISATWSEEVGQEARALDSCCARVVAHPSHQVKSNEHVCSKEIRPAWISCAQA